MAESDYLAMVLETVPALGGIRFRVVPSRIGRSMVEPVLGRGLLKGEDRVEGGESRVVVPGHEVR